MMTSADVDDVVSSVVLYITLNYVSQWWCPLAYPEGGGSRFNPPPSIECSEFLELCVCKIYRASSVH